MRGHRVDGHLGGGLDGVPEDAGADAGEGDALHLVLFGQRQGAAVAGCQQLGLARPAALPHGAHGVDDVGRGQAAALRELGLPHRAAPQQAALPQQLRPRGPVDGPIHAPTPQQRRVRRVDDGLHGQRCDVGEEGVDGGGHGRKGK